MSRNRNDKIARLLADHASRATYVRAKVSVLIPSQIRALRFRSNMLRQTDLARAAKMHQSRISTLETAGSNPTISTLSEVAAALNVGLRVEFVPFSEMLAWENGFSQDSFDVVRLENDRAFLAPKEAQSAPDDQVVWFHGTTKEKVAAIHKAGCFKKGTYFARHMEDAVTFGGPHVLFVKVRFASAKPDQWQVTCDNEIPTAAIQDERVFVAASVPSAPKEALMAERKIEEWMREAIEELADERE